MTTAKIREKLNAIKESKAISGICSECGFDLSYRHRHGCSIGETRVSLSALISALETALEALERMARANEDGQPVWYEDISREALARAGELLGVTEDKE